MSAVIILAPVVVTTAWPVISAAAITVMASLGYATVSTVVDSAIEDQVDTMNTVELEVENCQELGEKLGREEELVFEKEDITVTFKRDIRGRLQVCVSGDNITKTKLRELGEELANKVVQQYTYTRVIDELQNTEMSIIDQEVDEDETIKIKLRAWD
jgi:hypothetical protein